MRLGFLFLFINFLLFSQIVKAQTLWIKQIKMPFKEFKAHVKALDPHHISYAQSLLYQSRQQAKTFQLKKKLLIAQDLYLSGETLRALKAFKEISHLSLLADWDEEERRILLYAFLRQAQSEDDPEKRKALLLSASELALFQLKPSSYPDQDLFPPPLMKELSLIQEKSNFLIVNWNTIFPNHEIILVNGKKIKKEDTTRLPQAFYRISAFSSSHVSWLKKLNLAELLNLQIKTKALTKGFCENTKIKSEWNKSNIKLLHFPNCTKSNPFQLGKKNSKKNYRNNKIEKKWNSSFLDSEDFQSSLNKPIETNPSYFSNLSPWLIIGAGVITSALIISLSQQKKKEKTGYVY